MRRIKVLAARVIGGIIGATAIRRDTAKASVFTWLTLGIALLMLFALPGTSKSQLQSKNGNGRKGGFCSQTAHTLFSACRFEVKDDSFVKRAVCINISDAGEREECFDELEDEREEGNELCEEQRDARLDACKSLGEERYDPDFDPANFDDPNNPMNPNPYFPLEVGNRWDYVGGGEFVTVDVLNETKLVAGVSCIVVRDQVFDEDAFPIEDTDDWFAIAKDGNWWYCGEEVKDFETFDGDIPKLPELVSIDGSFKAGRDGDKPGIIFIASPMPGQVYRQEFSLGNAEDVAEVLSTTYAFGSDPDLDQSVPQELAELLCSGDCVVINEFTPIEPGIFARKYYAPGIGFFLEVVPDTGEVVQLVNCNFDNRCNNLPQP